MIARGLSAVGIIGAVHGTTVDPVQSDVATLRNYGEASLRAEGKERDRESERATRDDGNRSRWSAQDH